MDYNYQNNNQQQNNSSMNNSNNYYQNQNTNQPQQNNYQSHSNNSNMINNYNYEKNPNMNQNSAIGANLSNNQQEYNNIYQQPINQNNIQPNNNNNRKPNKFKIIGIIAIVFVILIIGIMIFGKNNNSSGGNGYTADYGQTLKVNELKGIYNFEIEVLSIEKNYPINYIFSETEGMAVKVTIKNNSEHDLGMALLSFSILDSKNNKISTATNISQGLVEDKSEALDLSSDIQSGKTITGYIYFYNMDSENKIDVNDADVTKLQLSVPSDILSEEDDDVFEYNVEEYYIKLK